MLYAIYLGFIMISACSVKNQNVLVEKSSADVVHGKIKNWAANASLWEKLISNITKKIYQKGNLSDDPMTNCYENLLLLNVFFVGEHRAKQIADLLKESSATRISLYGPYAEKYLRKECHVIHLLSGNAVLDINKALLSGRKIDIASSEVMKCLNIFKKHMLELYLTETISTSIFSFNDNVIDHLHEEMRTNKTKISEQCSMIYHVILIELDPLQVRDVKSIEAIAKIRLAVRHAFNLEQYFNTKNHSVCVRLHHAWMNQFTLSKHYEKQDIHIDESQFCKDLKGMLAYDGSKDLAQLRNCQDSCFKVHVDVDPSLTFRDDLDLFTGVSLRYITSQINPQDCLRAIDGVVKKFGD